VLAHEKRRLAEPAQVLAHEPLQAGRVGEDVDLDDPPAGDREAHDRNRPAAGGHDESGGAVDERRLGEPGPSREGIRLPGHGLRAAEPHRYAGTGVGAQDDVRVEQREECVEVAVARGGEEGVDDRALAGRIGVGYRCLCLDPAAGAAGELPGRRRGPPDDGCDVVEGYGEHVVQHEREPLGGSERVQHHEQREPDGVGQQRRMLGIRTVRAADDRLGQAQRFLTPGPARAQHVQAHPADDRRQPPAEVLDTAGTGAAGVEPGFLYRVVRLAQRAEHPVAHRPQVVAVLREPLREQFVLVHGHIPSVGFRHSFGISTTRRTRWPRLCRISRSPAPRTRSSRTSPTPRGSPSGRTTW